MTCRLRLQPSLIRSRNASCRVQIPIRALPTNDEEDLWTEVQLTHKCVVNQHATQATVLLSGNPSWLRQPCTSCHSVHTPWGLTALLAVSAVGSHLAGRSSA